MNIDLSTEYLGLKLCSPLIASASPCTGQPDVLRQLEQCGAGAAVLPSLFEEQVTRDARGPAHENELAGFPHLKHYNTGPENYAALVEAARQAVEMPIIGSLNGTVPGDWLDQATRIASAGADALELNLHFVPVDPAQSGQQVEARYLDIVAAVCQRIQIPLVVKLGPYFSSLPYFARQVVEAGAGGLVLFNRFLEPEVNLENQTIDPHLELSSPSEIRLSQRWIGILRDQLAETSLAATGGYHSGFDALQAIAIGADVVMVASVLLKHGAEHMRVLRDEMIDWMSQHGYAAVGQLAGTMTRERSGKPAIFERANYALTITSYMDQGTCPN